MRKTGEKRWGSYVLLSPRQLKQHKSDKRANMSAQMMTIAIEEHYETWPRTNGCDNWQVASGNSWIEAAEALIYNEKIDIETE